MSPEWEGNEEVRMQIFNTNLQYPSTMNQIITTIQIQISKDSLIIGSWESIWSLEFGYWNFPYFSSLLYSISNHIAKKRDWRPDMVKKAENRALVAATVPIIIL